MSKKIILLALSTGVLLAGCGEGRSAEQTVEKLQKTCDALTKADKEGRVYEAIIGKNVEEKTNISILQGRNKSGFLSKITLANNGKETTLHSEFIVDKEQPKKYMSILKEVMGVSSKNGSHENYVYGICGYKNEEGQYMDQIDTLTIIKGK